LDIRDVSKNRRLADVGRKNCVATQRIGLMGKEPASEIRRACTLDVVDVSGHRGLVASEGQNRR